MTAIRQRQLQLHSDNPERTEALGALLGGLLCPGDVICLAGQLGAGKTVFSRGIGAGWGATIPLSSPSYNLVHEHERERDSVRLYHLDLYRIEGAREADSLGIDDILDSEGIVIIEWCQRLESRLPSEHLWLDLLLSEREGRLLTFEASGQRHANLLAAFERAIPDLA